MTTLSLHERSLAFIKGTYGTISNVDAATLTEDLEAAIAAERSKEQAKPQQEPDFYLYPQHLAQLKLCDTLLCELSTVKMEGATACYTSPQPREPLSDDEIVMMYAENPTSDAEMIEFARAIEAQHNIGVKK